MPLLHCAPRANAKRLKGVRDFRALSEDRTVGALVAWDYKPGVTAEICRNMPRSASPAVCIPRITLPVGIPPRITLPVCIPRITLPVGIPLGPRSAFLRRHWRCRHRERKLPKECSFEFLGFSRVSCKGHA